MAGDRFGVYSIETGERIIFPSMVGSAHERILQDLFGANTKSRLDNLHVHIKEGQLEGEYREDILIVSGLPLL
jgi:hypothetical protein